ncbi:MAG: type I-U CRISPR-associated protein Csx17, partial [Deltaproteobacteria bacterium]
MTGRVELELAGCRSAPLARYLKALAVLRLVGQQSDPEARGAWRDDRFVLRSTLDREGLIAFFLDRYVPTPMLAPWHGGSGSYDGDPQHGIADIEASNLERFAPWRAVIRKIRAFGEMPPTFRTVGDVLGPIREEARHRSASKARDELQALLDEEEAARTEAAKVYPVDETVVLAEIEKRPEKPVKNWLKVLKKLRTQCQKLQREKGGKEAVQRAVRGRVPDAALPWLDAAFVLGTDALHGQRSARPEYNPLLGSGGNEGRLDYT